jgi:quercetin dioxygenase-like cupin family protein
MSNSFVNTHAQAGAQALFFTDEKVERRARLEGTWLNIFDVTVPSGCRTPLHRHASPEIFRIIEGRLTIRRMTDQGLEEFEATTGDIVRIDGDQAHGYSNPGPETAVFSAIIDSEMAEFFEATGSRDPSKAALSGETMKRVTVVANTDDSTILAA